MLLQVSTILDATRQSDGARVTLKAVDSEDHPFEVEIGRFLSSEELAQDSRNHCVPILDVLQDPVDSKKSIIVMPLLKTFYRPRFQTVGEVIAFFQQAIEVGFSPLVTTTLVLSIHQGLRFMHDHHVAHR